MSRWDGIDEFMHVVETGSFTGAAERLGMSKSYVSKQISQLEDRLKARLLQRTTRKLTLTEVGEIFYRECLPMAEQFEFAESAVADMQQKPQGTLKLALNSRFGVQYMAGAVAAFSRSHPELSVEVHSSFRDVDLVAEGYDLTIRYGKLDDSSLIARSLGGHTLCICATPEYWKANGQPQRMEALADHNCLTGPERYWMLNPSEGVTAKVKVSGSWLSEDGATIKAAALSGIGIAQLPDFYVKDAVEAGRLVKLHQPWSHYYRETWAVYPHSKHLSTKVRFFMDFLVTYFARDFHWDIDTLNEDKDQLIHGKLVL
ncbi:MAG: LysR family transcriptional regulator [Halioglobus sp.]